MEKFKKWFGKTSDTNLLLTITIIVFFIMYIGAIVFQGKGFLKPQTFFNILNSNAALIITACGMSLVMTLQYELCSISGQKYTSA